MAAKRLVAYWGLCPVEPGWLPVWKRGTPPRGLVRRASDIDEAFLITTFAAEDKAPLEQVAEEEGEQKC